MAVSQPARIAAFYFAYFCYLGAYAPYFSLYLAGEGFAAGEIAAIDFRPKLNSVQAPLLVLAGRYDHVAAPRFTLEFKTHAPQADFVMLEKSGHNFFLEENAKMLEALRGFLVRPVAR